jgi:hypothetical protein
VHFGRSCSDWSGTELTPSTSYHPQTDGQTEIVNKWVEGYLRNYVSGQQKAWIKWLHLGEHCYNTTYHMSIGMTPFEHCMAMMLLHLWIWHLGIAGLPKPRIGYRRTKDILKALKDNLQATQNQQKIYADRHRVERSFEVGDLVF